MGCGMLAPFLSFVLAVLVGQVTSLGQVQDADPNLLTNKVTSIVNDLLELDEMQKHLDSLSFSGEPLNGDALVTQIASSISTKFQSRATTVIDLKDRVATSQGQTTTETSQCCSLSDSQLTFDSRFNQSINTNLVCERVSSSAASNATHLGGTFIGRCIENLQSVPSLKWQYYGSEQGITTQFPGNKAVGSCTSYDNRFRPWYVRASVPRSKQIVIIIDKSGSMSNTYNGVTYMNLAKAAAKTIVATLNPNDEFAVVAFSTTAEVYSATAVPNSNCYTNTFAKATPYNTKKFDSFIDSIQASGATYYGNALNKAFDFFDTLEPSTQFTSDRVILFMSDGVPTDTSSTILQTLSTRNSAVNNSVVVLSYGMGSGIDFQVLESIATATTSQQGIFTQITTPSNLRNEMASYYNFFSIRNQIITTPVWTVPYLDAWGLGLMITAALPVYVNNQLVGVAAVDITIEELLADSSYFKPNELSYAFVTNQEGLVINHPLFPTITSDDPLFVDATAFERDSEFLSIYNSMKSGGSGNKTFTATRILPQGDSSMYGVREVSVLSTYYWKQIPDTTFSVCLVLASADTQAVLASQGSLSSSQFLYHRLDLVPPTKPCNQAGNYASQDKSAVALAPRSHLDPELYLSTTETTSTVRSLDAYMEGTSTDNVNVKASVKNMVVATNKADSLWLATLSNDLNKDIFWRYVGSSDGMYRIFPGTRMPNKYDPVARGWYQHAEANRDLYVITPPYSDAASGISIVTFARVLFEGKSGGNHNTVTDKVVGVMGIDMVLTAFNSTINALYPFCNESGNRYKCLVIDQGGFVIMSPSFTQSSKEFDKHIAELEPSIADILMGNGILQTKSCSVIETALVQKTYRISSTQTRFTGTANSGSVCVQFQLIPVASTNAYLLMVDTQPSGTCTSFQSCSCTTSSNIFIPTCPSTATCTCPCTSYNNDYHPCTNTYTYTSASSPFPCTPQILDLSAVGTGSVVLSDLPFCYETSFWPIRNSTITNGGLSAGAIAGIVVGSIAVFVVFVCVVYQFSGKNTAKTQSTAQRQVPQPQQALSPPPVQQSQAYPTAPAYSSPYDGYNNYGFNPPPPSTAPTGATYPAHPPVYHNAEPPPAYQSY